MKKSRQFLLADPLGSMIGFQVLEQRLMFASGIITFSAADQTNIGQTLHDGDEGSADIFGIQVDIYNAYINSPNVPVGSFAFFASSYTMVGNDGGIAPLDVTTGTFLSGNPPDFLVIKGNGGATFSFKSIEVLDYLTASGMLNFEAFRAGTSLGSVTLSVDQTTFRSVFTQQNGLTTSIFQNVDEIRISNATSLPSGVSGNWAAFNSIEIGDPVVPGPAAPTTTVSTASFSADTGTSSTDFITKTATQTISGTLSAYLASGESVEVSYDGGFTWSNASTYSVGSNSWSTTTTLSGSSTFEARVTNSGGSSTAYTHTYTLDTTAPTITFSGLTLSADTGASSSDFITQTAAQTITATLSSVPAGTDIVYGSLDNGATWTNITNKVSGTTLSWNGVTLTGSDTLKLKVTDVAGNDGAVSGQAYVLDTTAPTTTVATQSFSADTGTSSSDFVTKTASQTVSVTVSANMVAGEIVEVSLDNGTTWTTATTTVGSNTWTLSGVTLLGSNTLKVRVSDSAGNSGTVYNQAYVLDQLAPTVSNVTSSTANGTYKVGDTISVQVNFTEAVTITGTPQLTLETGTTDRVISYAGGSGTSTLTFTYTVQAGDTTSDLDYISTSALTLNGGTIMDAAGNNATLTLATTGAANSLGDNKNIVIDGNAPTTTSVSVPSNSTYGASANLDFTINFSENVTVNTIAGTPRIALTIGSTTRYASYVSGSGTSALLFRYTTVTGDNDSDGIAVAGTMDANGGTLQDAAGNDATLTLNSVGSTAAVLVSTNQAPVLSTPTTATYTDTSAVDSFSNTTGTLSATDNENDTIIYGITGGMVSGGVSTKAGTYGSLSVNTTTGAYTYTPSTSAIEGLTANTSETFTVTASDASSSGTATFTVNITAANDTPALTTPTAGAYTDTSANDIFSNDTGTLAGADRDAGQTLTYGISGGSVSGGTSTKAGSYGSLSVNTTTGAYTYTPNATAINALTANTTDMFTVTVSDGAGGSNTATYTVNLTAANDTPTLTTPTAGAYTDTSANDTFSNDTGTLAGADRDAGQTLTYGISGGSVSGGTSTKAGSYGSLSVNTTTGAYTYTPNATAINALTANTTDTFTVTVSDGAGGSNTATYTVNITGVNDLPTDISLTATSVSHSGGANATVGTLSTTDADAGDTHTYTLVSGVGDTNNGLFNISGTSLRATNAGSMALGTYTVRVQTTDAASTTYAEAMTITVADDVAPTVTSVSVPSNAWYVAGQNLDFTVNFSESVTVETTGGTPRIALTVGTTTVYADYESGSGTSALVFRYIVQANDLDTNGIAVGALALNGGTLADAAGNNAVLTLNSVGSTSAVLVDAVTPSAPSTPDLALASDTGTSNTDNITSDTTPTFTGTAEANSTVTLYDSNGITVLGTATADGTGAWTITSSALSGGTHNITVKTTDAAGNTSAASSPLAITVDATAPSAVTLSTTSVADTAATNGSTVATLSATDTTALTYALVAGAGDTHNGSFTISGGNLQAAANLAAGTYNIRVQATDAAGNTTEEAFIITVTAGPSVASINRVAGSALTNATSVDFTVTFNESVTGVDASDFALTTTGTAAGTIAGISGSGTTYTVTVNGLSGDGTLRLDLDSSGTGIINTGTQAITGGFTSGQTYTLDTSSPTAPTGLDLDVGSDSGTSNSDNVTSDNTPTVSGAGAEPGSTVTLYDSDGTTVLGTTTADGAGAWTITSSALSNGVHTLTAKVTDGAGNTGAASTPLSVTIDTTAPSVPGAIDLDSGSDTGLSNSDNVTSDTTPTFNGTAEANSTVTLYDTDGTTVLGTTTADGSGNWTITSSTLAGGSHTLTVKAKDAAGNESGASSSLSVTIDTTAPNAPTGLDLLAGSDSGTSNTDNITSNNTPTVSGAGAEPGSTVTLYDTNGTTVLGTATADSSGNWSVTTSTLADGAHTLTAKVTDTAGNVGVASSSLTVTIDSTAPGASGTPVLASGSDSGVSNADNITSDTTPTITGSGAEAGATVTLYDTNGSTVLGTATADGSGNWSITSSTLSEGAHNLTTKVTDTAGNTSVASASLAMTVDTTAPTAITLSANSVMDVATGTNTAVATLSSTDTQSVTYTLEAGNGTNDAGNASFVIAGGVLQSRSQLTAGTYNIRVGATDAAGNISYQTFVITVNTNTAPSITSVATASVAENAAISTVVYTATATDVDAGQTLSYSLTGTDAGSFDINASTGVVTLKASANYESKASYSFNVVATDNGTGTLTDTKAVTVSVTDVNEAPTITSVSTGTVAENAAITTVVYTAAATDVDSGQTLSYSLTGTDAGSFDIDASTGVVTLKASANYESKASYSFNVVASDNGTGSLTDTKAVTVTVTNVNEAPTITSGASGTVTENAATSTVVYTATATDVDAGQTLSYSLTGTDAGSFDIDASTGVVTLKASANYESKASYSFNVVATDNGTGTLTDTKAVTVSVTDVNEVTVVISSEAFVPTVVSNVLPAVEPLAVMSVIPVNLVTVPVAAPVFLTFERDVRSDVTADARTLQGFSVPVVNRGSTALPEVLVLRDMANQSATRIGNQLIVNFDVPATTFAHTDPSASVTLSAALADGRPLPGWLKFNPITGEFRGIAPENYEGSLEITVVATDNNGSKAVTRFRVDLTGKSDKTSDAGKPRLQAEMMSQSSFAWKAERDAWIRHAREASKVNRTAAAT